MPGNGGAVKRFFYSASILLALLICQFGFAHSDPATYPDTASDSDMPRDSEPVSDSSAPDFASIPDTEPTPSSEVSGFSDPVPGIEEQKIPDVLVLMDSENGPRYAIVVEKDSQQLFVYSHSEKDGFSEVYRFECSTGKSAGPKTVSGDGKTPEGVYFFIKSHEKKELSPIYGIMAFPTDYPNALDKTEGRTGNAIWLHGTNKPLVPRDSNGCVVLDDKNLLKVAELIELKRTPIIITAGLSYGPARERERESILNIVENWNKAVERGTYHDYLRPYDSDYLPDISWWPEWNRTRKEMEVFGSPPLLNVKNISIFRHKNGFLALFDQYMEMEDSNRTQWIGSMKFFLEENENGMSVMGEEYLSLPEYPTDAITGNPILSAYGILEKELVAKAEIAKAEEIRESDVAEMVDGWLKSWSSKDMDSYKEYYSKKFRSNNMNLRAWIRHKAKLNKKYEYIRVSRKDMSIKKDDRKITVSFVQNYESPSFKAVGKKQLILKQESGKWKIYREIWEKM